MSSMQRGNEMDFSTDRAAKPPIETPSDHVRVLHADSGARAGTVAVIQRPGRWRERPVPLRDLTAYVRALPLGEGSPDTYMSQGRFSGRRLVARLVTISSLWVDLDFYKMPSFVGASAQDVLAAVLARCDAERIPEPSYVISTGRGLCAVWLHEPVVRHVEPRWRAAVVGLADRFADLGMDRAPRHPAAVFRLVGSRHTGADCDVRCIFPSGGEPHVYGFETLFGLFAPAVEPVVRVVRPGRRPRVDPQIHAIRLAAAEGQLVGPWGLWGRRLDDLQALRVLRFFGPLPPGHRNNWLFLCACALSWMVPVGSLRRELVDLAREATGGAWSEQMIMTDMGSAIRRAEAAARGEVIDWPPGSGETRDPRYRYRDVRIIQLLDITLDELGLLPASGQLGPASLSARQAARGRRSGLARLEGTVDRDREIACLRAEEGLTQGQIAYRVGLSQRAVSKVLARLQNSR